MNLLTFHGGSTLVSPLIRPLRYATYPIPLRVVGSCLQVRAYHPKQSSDDILLEYKNKSKSTNKPGFNSNKPGGSSKPQFSNQKHSTKNERHGTQNAREYVKGGKEEVEEKHQHKRNHNENKDVKREQEPRVKQEQGEDQNEKNYQQTKRDNADKRDKKYQHERRDQQHERRDERHERRDQQARRDQQHERRDEKHERRDERHEKRDQQERRDERYERRDQKHERDQPKRGEQQHERRDQQERRDERHERRDQQVRRDQQHERRNQHERREQQKERKDQQEQKDQKIENQNKKDRVQDKLNKKNSQHKQQNRVEANNNEKDQEKDKEKDQVKEEKEKIDATKKKDWGMGLSKDVEKVLKEYPFDKPTHIQRDVIPVALSDKHILASAKTGTGKTLAYILPVLTQLGKFREADKEQLLNIGVTVHDLKGKDEAIKEEMERIADFSKNTKEDVQKGDNGEDSTAGKSKDNTGEEAFVGDESEEAEGDEAEEGNEDKEEEEGEEEKNEDKEEEEKEEEGEEEEGEEEVDPNEEDLGYAQETENQSIVHDTEMTPEVAKEMQRLQRMIDSLGDDPDVQKLDQAKKKKKKETIAVQRRNAVAKPTALIITPTRELAEQVHKEIVQATKYMKWVRSAAIFGGVGEHSQVKSLIDGVDVIVATPGRLLSFVKWGTINLQHVKVTVVDECDKMMNMGFLPDMREVFSLLPAARDSIKHTGSMQTMFFSATLLPELQPLMLQYAPQGVEVNLNVKMRPVANVDHYIYDVSNRRKYALLKYFLYRKGNVSLKGKPVLVFVRTQQRVERLVNNLVRDGFHAGGIHNGKTVAQRRRTVDMFREYVEEVENSEDKMVVLPRNTARIEEEEEQAEMEETEVTEEDKVEEMKEGEEEEETDQTEDDEESDEKWSYTPTKVQILVSTEVMARGVDIPNLPLVLNFDVPLKVEEYVHRIGRTGRAGNKGRAITFVSKSPIVVTLGNRVAALDEKRYWADIAQFLGKGICHGKVPGPWRDEALSPEEEISTYHKRLSVEESKRLLERRLRKEENINMIRAQKRGKKLNRLKSDRNAFAQFKRLEEVDKKINEREEREMGRLRREKHLPQLEKMQEGKYENVIADFEKKRARRRGTNLPPGELLEKWKKQTFKKRMGRIDRNRRK